MPGLGTLYVADQAWCPYGGRPAADIQRRSLDIARFLLGQGAGVLVVACNTATTQAIAFLRQELAVPVVGIEPATKPAALQTRTGRIAVLATSGTLSSAHYQRTLGRFAPHCQVGEVVVPELVPLIESGVWEGEALESVLGEKLDALVQEGVDQLILGCTHYPFLAPWIVSRTRGVLQVLDPSPAVASRVKHICTEQCSGSLESPLPAHHEFWSTRDNGTLRLILSRWGVDACIRDLELA